MESAEMISAPSCSARWIATSVFPTAVGPTKTNSVGVFADIGITFLSANVGLHQIH